jgi:hypothetical protein
MSKIINDNYSNTYYLTADEKDENDLITVSQIKEILKAIQLLNNNKPVEIYINSGCIDVAPVNKEVKMNFDTPIFKEFKVTKLNTNSINVLIDGNEYKTKRINDSYIYESKTYYSNTIRQVIFKY